MKKISAKVTERSIKDYLQDPKNFNKGNSFGEALIEKSISKLGAGRSLLAASDGTLIAGNKSHQKFSELGIDKVIEVETDGNTVVVVKRTDIKSGSKKFHELALADNMSALKNISMDEALMEEVCGEEICREYGMDKYSPENKEKEVDENLNTENECPLCGYKW